MKNIILAIDFVEDNKKLINKSLQIVERFNAKVWVIHIAAPDPDFVGFGVGPNCERKFRADVLREEHRNIQEIAMQFRERGIEAQSLLIPGSTAETIVQQAEKHKADMIIIGFQKGGILSTIFGDVTIEVMNATQIPVLCIPSSEQA